MAIGSKLSAAGAPTSSWPLTWAASWRAAVAVGADARPATAPVFVVTEIPDAAAENGGHLADAERVGRGHDILREPSRHKMPQKLPQTGISEEVPERQRPM